MKEAAALLTASAACLSLASCGGYNTLMRNRLSNENSYISIEAQFYDYKDFEDGMYVYVKGNESMNAEDGSRLFEFCPHDQNIVQLELIGGNYEALKETFANGEISSGTHLEMKCSNWIYMDTNFYYIAELKTPDKVYLPFEEGLRNIVEYMDQNVSIF